MSEGLFPRASNSNLLNSSPLVVTGLKGTATAVETAITANQGDATPGTGLLGAGLLAFDVSGNTNYRRLMTRVSGANDWSLMIGTLQPGADAFSNNNWGAPNGATFGWNSSTFYFNGTTWDRARTNSAANVSATTQPFAAMVAPPGEWTVLHTPAANTQATATKAAGAAGVRHVAKTISYSMIGVGAVGALQINLRDGATGAGTILWSLTLLLAAGQFLIGGINVNIPGSAATAMTLEFSAGPGATNFESVTLTGYSTI